MKIKKKLLELEGVKIIDDKVVRNFVIDIEETMKDGYQIEVDLG